MPRLFTALAVFTTVLLICGCAKDHQPEDTLLTGTWIKGANAGDTLYFTKDSDKSILRYNASFNPGLTVITQTEYSYVNRKLAIRNYLAAENSFYTIQSFQWIREGKEFEILGHEIFPFMASTAVGFIYKKIN